MTPSALDPLKRSKGWLTSHATRTLDVLSYRPWGPARWRNARLAGFWDRQAPAIHEQWGRGDWDYAVLGSILQAYRPASVLDIGCGSGRLFPLYNRHGVGRVLGIDLSETALAIARRDYPAVATQQGRIEDAGLPPEGFDLIVSNRVLQHVPRERIIELVERLCVAGRLVYLNELSSSDGLAEEFFMFRHDYQGLFGAHGWRVAEQGLIGRQTYLLLQAPGVTSPA